MSSENIYQSSQIRKEILRNVFINAQVLQKNVNTRTIENLEYIIDKVDTINKQANGEEKITDQTEIVLDSKIMTISSNVLKKCTLSLSKNFSCYNSIQVAEKIKTFLYTLPDTILDDRQDWTLLGDKIQLYFKHTAYFSMVLGTIHLIPKKEIIRYKTIREVQAPTKRPENIKELDKIENTVEQTVVEVTKVLGHYQKCNKKPLDFFALVLHPTDFGKTIENVLHVSFLIRDGIIQFITDEDGVPQLRKINKSELLNLKEVRNEKKKNVQNVLTLSMIQWKELVRAYKIEKPMIDLH